MNLFQIATNGIDLDAIPITADERPPREGFQFEPSAAPQQRLRLPPELDEVFRLAAAEYDIDPDVLRGIAYAESRFNPDIISGKVKSKAGAIGLMQFMPDTAKEYGVDPTDPAQSIIGAAAYLRKSLDKFGGDYERAVASYNWGPNRKAFDSDDWVGKAPKETRNYLGTVFDAAVRFRDGEAERSLPAGVEPSKAGAGRGVVSPGMVNTRDTQVVAQPASQANSAATGRTWGDVASDTSKSLAQGLLDIASLPGAAYSAATGGWNTGYMNAIRGTQDVLQEQKSPYIQAQQKELQEKLKTAEGWREKFAVGGVETITNPALLADTLARSVPGMIAGGLAGRAAGAGAEMVGTAALARTIATGSEAAARVALVAKNGAGLIARGVATGTAASQQGVSVANEVYGELSKLPPEAFSSEPEFEDLVKRFGPDKAKDVLASAAANRALMLATGASALSMKLVPGGSAIETMFLPKNLTGEAAKAVASTALLTKPIGQGMSGGVLSKTVEMMVQGAKTGGSEAISEGIEEATGAGAKGLELSRAGQAVDLGEMMGEAGGQGAAAGLVMGNIAGVREAYQAPRVENQPTTPQAPTVTPQAPVTPDAAKTQAVDNIAKAIQEMEGGAPAQPAQPVGTTGEGAGVSQPTQGVMQPTTSEADVPSNADQTAAPSALAQPTNFSATPTATVGTQTNVQAGPGFTGQGIAAEMAALKARSQPQVQPAQQEQPSQQQQAQPRAPAQPLLNDTEREMLADFERLYQADVKGEIKTRLGLIPARQEEATPPSAKKKPSTVLAMIKQAGGINPKVAADVFGDRAVYANRAYPGLFKTGGMNLDLLVPFLKERGFLTQADEDSTLDNGGVNKVSDLLQRELSGERVRLADDTSDMEARSAANARAELDDKAFALGLPQKVTSEMSDERLSAIIGRIERKLGRPVRADFADRKMTRTEAIAERQAILMADRVERARAQYDADIQAFAEANDRVQEAVLDVMVDEDGNIEIIYESTVGEAYDDNRNRQEDSGKAGAPDTGGTTEGAGNPEADRTEAGAGAQEDGGRQVADPGSEYSVRQQFSLFGGEQSDQLQLFIDSGPVPSQAGPGAVAAQREAVAAIADMESTASILAKALSRDYAARQRVSLVGQTVKSSEDLAVLAHVYRDPRFETFRAIFVDDGGNVVSQLGLTSRLPASASAIVGSDIYGYLRDLADAAKKTGATGYYLLHNHPSGQATPSSADLSLTRVFNQHLPGLTLKSHVVIDTNEYATIDWNGNPTLIRKDFGQSAPDTSGPAAGFTINGPDDVLVLARQLKSDSGAVTLVATDAQYKVKAVTTIPSASLTGSKGMLRLKIARALMRLQSSNVFAIGRESGELAKLNGIVVDAIHVEESGRVSSMVGRGIISPSNLGAFPSDRRTRVSADSSAAFAYLKFDPSTLKSAGQRVAEGLSTYTPAEVTARQDAEAEAEAATKRAEDAAARAEAAAKQASEIAQRSVAAADTFEFGQSAEDNLSGQQGLKFSKTNKPIAILDGTEVAAEITHENAVEVAREWYRANLQGDTVTRDSFGEVGFSGKGIKEFRLGLRHATLKAKLLPAVRALIQSGEYHGQEPLYKQRNDDIVAFHFFSGKVAVDGKVVTAGVSVHEDSRGNFFYNVRHDDSQGWKNRNPQAGPWSAATGLEGLQANGEPSTKQSVSDDDGNVNLVILDGAPRTPTTTIREAISKAYGNLLSRLESKGLVSLTQTEEDAIAAAAQARADKTGGDVEAIKASLRKSVAGDEIDVKRSADGNLEGFFDPETGKSYLIADNLTEQSAPGTLMHEVGLHMAADGKLQPLFDRAAQLLADGKGNAFIDKVQARLDKAGETSAEEAAAYIVTEYENDRTNAPASVTQWIKDFIADVRAWLFNKGGLLKADSLTVADIAAVARANARSLADGKGWTGYAQKDGAFRFGNTDGQRSKDIATVAEAFSGEGIQLEGFSNFDGAQTGVRLKDAPTYTMEFKVQPGAGPLIVDATQANGETGQSPGGNAGQRMYQALFAWVHNNGRRVDADYSLSYVNELRRTSAMLSSALRFGTIDHFGELNEQQGVEGWDATDFDTSVRALADAELRKVEQRVPVFSSLAIDPATGRVYASDSTVLEQLRDRMDREAPVDGRLGADQSGAGRARNFAELEAGLASRKKDTRPVDGVSQDAVGAQARGTDTVGDGTSIQGNSLSDSELARYLASTRGGFEAHGVGVSTLKRALITRDHGGSADLPGLLYSVAGEGDIRRSVRGGGPQQASVVTTWDDLGDSKMDALIYEGQDDRIDLKRVQENIVKAGRQIREEFDARMAETLFPGRVAKRNESFVDQEVKPLLQAMAASNVSMEELGDYLLARHAPERNAQIAKVNPDMPDGGAGTNSQGVLMTTQAANDYIANLSPGKRTALQLLAKRVDAITKGTRDLLITEGLEKASTVAAWEGAYQNYVPLFKDEAAEAPGHPVGSGFSVKGGASKRAMGSTKEVTNVLAHVLMQREAAITRAEKNRVGMSLYGLALSNPNKAFWGTVVPKMSTPEIMAELQNMGVNVADAFAGMEATPTIRYVDPTTGLVTERPNPVYKNLDNALVVKVNGEDRVLLFNKKNDRAMRLAESLKNQNRGSGVFVDGANLVAPVTRFMASMLTQYNPAFGMVNAVRDVQGALVNLSSTELKGQQAKVLAAVPAAMKGIARDLRGDKARTQWSDLWVQFQEDGGRTGVRDLISDPYEKAGQIEKDLKRLSKEGKLTPGNAAHAVLDLLSDFNDTLENGVRLAAYKTAIEQGMSRPAAAKLARELTVDFNRKGRTGREFGKLYAFLNASIQGSARTIQTLKGPMGAKIMAGGFALGVLQAFMLAAAGFDDEDIPEFIKSRNLIIPMGSDRYVTIPMALGLHVLPNAGRVVSELVMSGGKDLGEKSLSAITEIVTSFNPFGGGGDWTSLHGPVTMLAPTVADPFFDLMNNRDFTGRQISKERRNPGDVRPGATMARESTKKSPSGQVYIGISEAINAATGGTDVTKGKWSPTPEELRYMATVVGGGVYRETERAINAAVLLARGEEVKPHQVPLGSRFAGEVDDEMSTMSRYYKNDDRLNKFWSEFKAEANNGNTARIEEMKRDPRFAAAAMNSKIEQHITKLNKLASENVGDKEKYDALNRKRAELMKKVNDAVAEAEKQ